MKTNKNNESRNETRNPLSWNPLKSLTPLVVLLLSLASAPSWGATVVCGIIDGEVWNATGSPYYVDCDVLVSSLMIEPGVEVSFLSNYVFSVEGILQVKGTAASPVRFTTTNTEVGWQGISFVDSVQGSFFHNCIIEYSRNSAVRITNSALVGGAVPSFTNCTIINNSSPDYGGGIDATLTSGDLVLDNCLIRSNTCAFHGGGINAIIKNGILKMVHCTIVSNVANVDALNGGTYVGGGVRISGASVFLNCTNTDNLCNGRVYGNFQDVRSYGGAIYSDSGDALFRNCVFQRNIAQTFHCCFGSSSRAWGAAVYFQDQQLTMQNCIVATNTCSSSSDSSGAGVFVASGTADIINCTIVANNTQGIYNNGGTVNCLNSIVYFNNSSSDQIGGAVTSSYSDVQGGGSGLGNKAVSPNLRPATLELLSSSPCVDMGNPDPIYNDSCIPPSRGTVLNDMGAFGGPAACCWVNPCAGPVITSQPPNSTTCVNGEATVCVTAIGDQPLHYQWRFRGLDVNNTATNLTSGTNACLIISNVQSINAGYYDVVVANALGTVVSSNALLSVTPVCVEINLYAGLTLSGGVAGQVYNVQYVTNLSDTSWTTLTTVTQEISGVFVLDPQPANRQRRFYRVVP